MISFDALDKSETKLLGKLLSILTIFNTDFRINTVALKSLFSTSTWFALKMKQNNYVEFLSASITGGEAKAMQSLIYAFSHPATLEGVLRLCVGLFGEESIISVTIDPGLVNINVENVNLNFVSGLVDTQENRAITTWPTTDNKHKWIVAQLFTNLGITDVDMFFQQFVPPGVKIHLEISI